MTSGSDREAPTVLLHGFTASAGAWGEGLLRGLREAGLEPRPLDLPCHGARAGYEGPDPTLEGTLTSIDEEAGPSYDLVGYSMGGRIALHQAVRAPERIRRLVLESASPGLAGAGERARRRAADAALAERIVEGGIEAFVDAWEAGPLFASQSRLPAEVRAAHRERRLTNVPGGLAAALRGLGTGTLPSLWHRLSEVEIPTLILVGSLDEKFVAIGRRMAGALPDGRLAVVPDAGHTVHLERPDAWLDRVTAFLSR